MRPLLVSCLFWAAGSWQPGTTNWQAVAEKELWHWQGERASLLYSVNCYFADYDVVIHCAKGDRLNRLVTVRLQENGREIYTFQAKTYWVFCTRTGHHLLDQVFWWCTWLHGCRLRFPGEKGVVENDAERHGAPGALVYGNLVTIDSEGDVLVMRGNEGFGRYIEYVDKKTVKTVGHKKYPE